MVSGPLEPDLRADARADGPVVERADGPVVERADARAALRADCARCAALCCVAPSFAESSEFAFDKAAGEPCVNLAADFRCAIHPNLRERGFAGCVAYDCFGAGQKVTQETFGGRSWRDGPEVAGPMFEAFGVVRALHELLWYLEEALSLSAARSLWPELRALREATDRLAAGSPASLRTLDVGSHHRRVNGVLRRAAALARAGSGGPGLNRRGADLAGADLRDVDLRGADLRGALLLGADLRGCGLAQRT